MYSAQGKDDYCGAADRMLAHSETLGQVVRKFPYDSYDTYVLNNDKSNVVAKRLPHPPLKGNKNLLRRTQSNPEGGSMLQGEELQMRHLPSLTEKKTLRMEKLKEEDQTHGMLTSNRDNELNALTKIQRIPERLVNSVENPAVMDTRNAHKKLERSKTTPVRFLKPILKASPLDIRRSTVTQRGYSIHDKHSSPRTHSTTSNSSRNTSLKDGSVYGPSDIEPHGIFKNLEKTYVFSEPRVSTMTKALPNGRRFGTGRIEEKCEGELTNTVPGTSLSSPKQLEKTVYTQRKFTRTGKLTGLQFIDDSNQADVQANFESTQEKNPEQSQDLTYLRFTKERQEDNRI